MSINIFTQNSDLRKGNIYGWTLPAHHTKLSDGKKFNTCPQAGVCGAFCYAKNGTYNFPDVKKAHLEKLEWVLNDLNGWAEAVRSELTKEKYFGGYVRIHDGGDFFSQAYAEAWFRIARNSPHVNFYSYTKEVKLFKEILAGKLPKNFTLIYSFGGKQDHMIDREVDRHSDVFPDYDEMILAGYNDIGDDDKLSAYHPNHKVGLFRNNIPHFIKKMGKKKFSEWSKK
jgi:hypothetical protein